MFSVVLRSGRDGPHARSQGCSRMHAASVHTPTPTPTPMPTPILVVKDAIEEAVAGREIEQAVRAKLARAAGPAVADFLDPVAMRNVEREVPAPRRRGTDLAPPARPPGAILKGQQ